jgi:hypothetical protein
MKHLVFALLVALVLGAAAAAFAADIVTCPTANQLKAGEVDLAAYYLFLDMPSGTPQFVRVQTLYVGITDRLELDAHRYDQDLAMPETMWIASYKIASETATCPDIVLGARDLADDSGSMPHKTSYYVSAAKTLNPPAPGEAPDLPIWRLHLSFGSADPSLLGEDRHDGIFGGIQVLITPEIGAIALHDGEDVITGLTYTLPCGTVIKGGTFGDHHSWVGISHTFTR